MSILSRLQITRGHSQRGVFRTMKSLRSKLSVLFIGASLCAPGCDDSTPPSVDSSNTEATVKGTVMVKGNPVTEGEISFDASNFKRADAKVRTAPIEKDGTYTIKALTGENIIRLAGPSTKKDPSLQYAKRAYNVKPGVNTFDFTVGEMADTAK